MDRTPLLLQLPAGTPAGYLLLGLLRSQRLLTGTPAGWDIPFAGIPTHPAPDSWDLWDPCRTGPFFCWDHYPASACQLVPLPDETSFGWDPYTANGRVPAVTSAEYVLGPLPSTKSACRVLPAGTLGALHSQRADASWDLICNLRALTHPLHQVSLTGASWDLCRRGPPLSWDQTQPAGGCWLGSLPAACLEPLPPPS